MVSVGSSTTGYDVRLGKFIRKTHKIPRKIGDYRPEDALHS